MYNHPTIKPLNIISNVISNSSHEGDVVLDCFMGSGTVGVACKELNRNFIGIEIDSNYYEIAKKKNRKYIKWVADIKIICTFTIRNRNNNN